MEGIIITKIIFAGVPFLFISGVLCNYICFYTTGDRKYWVTALSDMLLFAASICMAYLFYEKDDIVGSVKAIDFSSVNDIACLIGILVLICWFFDYG